MDCIVLGLPDSNNTSGLRETDNRDLPQRRQHIYNEKVELPERRDKTKGTAGGWDSSFYSSASGIAHEETSRSNKHKYRQH